MLNEVNPSPPSFADALDAKARIAPYAVRTPLLESAAINEVVGGRVLIKAECLQRTGAFKFRGAYNKLARLSPAERSRGIVAFSGGNHAQGAAAAAKLLGIDAIVLMPSDAPPLKIRRTRAYGADVRLYDRHTGDRDAMAAEIIASSGRSLIHPSDDPDIIAGQATVGIEMHEQAQAMDAALDAVLVCCGGGGLTAGVGLVMRKLSPGTEIYAVEPRDFDDTRRSLISGRREANDSAARSVCDALLTQLGPLTFEMNRRQLTAGLTVTDEQAQWAMAVAFEELKLVLEPGGAVALAAALSSAIEVRGRTIAVVASGGNVEAAQFCAALDAYRQGAALLQLPEQAKP